MLTNSNQYDFVKHLGNGGFGVVSLVRDKSSKALLVVKQIDIATLMQKSGADDGGEKLRKMTLQEAELMRNFVHCNIVKFHGSFMENDFLHIVMEYCESGSLKDVVKGARAEGGNYLPEVLVRKWACQIVPALQFIHDRKLLHRDIKTDNVFVASNKEIVKLGDFGIAKILEGTAAGHTFIGTMTHMPPEMWKSVPCYTVKSESWALGVLLYELLALKLPFPNAAMMTLMQSILNDKPQPLPDCYLGSFRELIVHRLLDKNDLNRPSMDEIMKFLKPQDGNVSTKVSELEQISASNQYITEKVLGIGGFGEAILAHLPSDPERKFVVKRVDLARLSNGDDKIKQMALREAGIMLSLKQQPNIVCVYGSFTEANAFHIVMEYCDEGTLKDAIKKGKPFTEQVVCRWLAQLVMTLKHLHNNNILHRDVKADNIFIANKGQTIKLGDFGIAKALENTFAGHTRIGTLSHFPPELFNEPAVYNFKSEVWAVGVVTYEIMALELPFDAGLPHILMAQICGHQPKPLPDNYSLELQNLVLQGLMSKAPENRPSMDSCMGHPCILQAILKMANSNAHHTMRSSESSSTMNAEPKKSSSKSSSTANERNDEKLRAATINSVNVKSQVVPKRTVSKSLSTGNTFNGLLREASRGDYFSSWSKKPNRHLYTATSSIQAIFQKTAESDPAKEKSIIIIVCLDATIVALNWDKMLWRGKFLPCRRQGTNVKVEVWHSVYDEVADKLYVVLSQQRQEIYQANWTALATDPSHAVSLEILFDSSVEIDGTAKTPNYRGLAVNAERRLLFACTQQDKNIVMWRLTDDEQRKPILLGCIACKVNPWLCSIYFSTSSASQIASMFDEPGDTQSEVALLAVSDTFRDRVELFSATLKDSVAVVASDFQFIASLSSKTPAEIQFDAAGRLFCCGFDNNRLRIFSSRGCSSKTSPMQLQWSSNDCGAMLCRLAIGFDSLNRRNVAIIGCGNSLDCFT